MNRSQQRIISLDITDLKNVKNLHISFEDKNVTAILGPNGNGKSTILHALACVYKPQEIGENYRFSSFFLPSTDALWGGSNFKVKHRFRRERDVTTTTREYKKTAIRWTPRYAKRPIRDSFFIGIDKCVPMIEKETRHARINYETSVFSERIVNQILEKASYVLNKRYETLNIHTAGNKRFIGVVTEGLQYSAISMSAGEQKVFFILEKLFKANPYSLILIDELDLLLHDLAFKRLVEVIVTHSENTNLQVIFTTHRESVVDLERQINVRHLINRDDKTLCFNETKPSAIDRLTGSQSKPLEIFVEDDLAATIVKKIATQNKIGKYLSVTKYGACINCFSVAAGLLLGNENCDNVLLVTDGDLYNSDEDINQNINRVITGGDDNAVNCREKAKEIITQLILPEGISPERFIHTIISSLPSSDNEEYNEIIEAAKEIRVVKDNHKYIDDIINRIGWDKLVGVSKIVDLLSTTDSWGDYTTNIYEWVNSRKENLLEEAQVEAIQN